MLAESGVVAASNAVVDWCLRLSVALGAAVGASTESKTDLIGGGSVGGWPIGVALKRDEGEERNVGEEVGSRDEGQRIGGMKWMVMRKDAEMATRYRTVDAAGSTARIMLI